MNYPVTYTPEQMEQVQQFINRTFGGEEDGMIAHEITSEYVHTDTAVIAPQGEDRVFATFGMGARAMNAPENRQHIELVMCASKKLDIYSQAPMTIVQELVSLSKYPFQEDTWLGVGHTIQASHKFRDAFGFDAFTFVHSGETVFVDGIGTVEFLMVVPIYEQERQWLMETDSVAGMDEMYQSIGPEIFLADSRREMYLPEDRNLCSLLGLDEETLWKLRTFLQEAEERGEQVDYDKIGKWLAENG